MKTWIMLAGALFALSAHAAPEELMGKAGCTACHAMDAKMLGPSFKSVAAKYKGQDMTAKLMEKVRKGGAGSFGNVPMPPNPPDRINDADLKTVVDFILKS